MHEPAYMHLLERISKINEKYGDKMQPPASEAEVQELQSSARRKLKVSIPDEYAELLCRTNGVDWNGLSIYATSRTPIIGFEDRFIPGFVDTNLAWRENPDLQEFVFFGDDGETHFALSLQSKRYEMFTTFLTHLRIFDSFEEMIAHALHERF